MIFLWRLSCCQTHKGSERHRDAVLQFSGEEAAAPRPSLLSVTGTGMDTEVEFQRSPQLRLSKAVRATIRFPPPPLGPQVTERLHFSRLPKQSSPLSDGDAPSSHPPQIFTITGAVLTFLCHKHFGLAYRSLCLLCVPEWDLKGSDSTPLCWQ